MTVTTAPIISLAELEARARAVMDPAAFDYIAGGAWDEQSLAEAEAAWRRRRLRPRVLVDVARVDPSTTLAGTPAAAPFAIAPMAAHALAHPEGEVATARAAAAAGIPFTLSTMATTSIEDIAAAAPDGVRWFQLYAQADPGRSRSLVERAAAAGYAAIILTVDLPVLGYRERDMRSGFNLSVPLMNFPDGRPTHVAREGESGYDVLQEDLDRGLVWSDLATIRSWSSLPLFLKGILTAEDARRQLMESVEAEARWRSALAQPATDRSAASPYSRAIEMARNGAEISTIAGTCGISRGEAELLVALHRSGISSS